MLFKNAGEKAVGDLLAQAAAGDLQRGKGRGEGHGIRSYNKLPAGNSTFSLERGLHIIYKMPVSTTSAERIPLE